MDTANNKVYNYLFYLAYLQLYVSIISKKNARILTQSAFYRSVSTKPSLETANDKILIIINVAKNTQNDD